jgi:hypothetical protein
MGGKQKQEKKMKSKKIEPNRRNPPLSLFRNTKKAQQT